MGMINMFEFSDKFAIVYLSVKVWTASRNNKPKDLGLEHEISKEVASLGGKSVFNKKKIAFMTAHKRDAIGKLNQYGFPCFGGWAIPKKLVDEVEAELEFIRISYYQKLEVILASYESECEAWIQLVSSKVSIPGFDLAIRSSLYTKEYIRNQVQFTYQVNKDLMDNPVGDAALMTIADLANESLTAFQYSMAKGHGFTRKSLAYLSKVREKLAQLSMVDAFVQPAIEQIEAFEAKWPTRSGQLDQNLMSGLMGQLSLLANPEYLDSLRKADFQVVDTPEDTEEDDEDAFMAGFELICPPDDAASSLVA